MSHRQGRHIMKTQVEAVELTEVGQQRVIINDLND